MPLATDGHGPQITLVGNDTINFQQTLAAGDQANFNCLLLPGSNTPTFQFNAGALTSGTGLLPTLGTNPVGISFRATSSNFYITGAAEIT